jgi:hypothetical protein
MVHRFHSPRIRWIASLQHGQTATETGTSKLERKNHRGNLGEDKTIHVMFPKRFDSRSSHFSVKTEAADTVFSLSVMTRSNHVQQFINHKSTLSASAIPGIHEKKRGLPPGYSMFQVRILEVSKGEPTIVQTSRM